MLDVCDTSLLVSKISPLPPAARRASSSKKATVDKVPDSLIDNENFIVARPPIAPRNAKRPVPISRGRASIIKLKSAELLSAEKRQLKKMVDASMTKRSRALSENNLHASPSRSDSKGTISAVDSVLERSVEDTRAQKARQRKAIYALNKLMTELENNQFDDFLSSGCSKPTGV